MGACRAVGRVRETLRSTRGCDWMRGAMSQPIPATLLAAADWQERARVHRERAERHTVPARHRRERGLPHPIADFLFEYYPFSCSLLERWQPGAGIGLEWDAAELPSGFSPRWYAVGDGWLAVDPQRLAAAERQRLAWIAELLQATLERPPNFGCHGLHEWAMVFQGASVRHERTLALRLPRHEIDAVVAALPIRCSHHDAFRFFAPAARPLNQLQPSLESRVLLEQPGCLHANMDLYKWAAKTLPWTGSDLLLDCFELAMDLRELDMRASPYDLSGWDREPIRIETAEGRKEYETAQKNLAARARPLRQRLIEVLRQTLAAAGAA